MARSTILVIEDDPDIQELLKLSLGRDGFDVHCTSSAEEGLAWLDAALRSSQAHLPAVILLDVMLPGMSGIDALRTIKNRPDLSGLGVIMASARGEDPDVVLGLELGADDYVVKPYSPRVLVARIRRLVARRTQVEQAGQAAGQSPAGQAIGGQAPGSGAQGPTQAGLRCGPFSMVPDRFEASASGRRLELSATEFALLELFIRNPGMVFTRTRLISAVRGDDHAITDRAVDVQILGLRKKLGPEGDWIETVRGVGYRLRDTHA